MRRTSNYIGGAVGALALFFALGFSVRVTYIAPDYALVMVDPADGTYFAPPCVAVEGPPRLVPMTFRRARNRDLKPDDRCRNANGFIQQGRSYSGRLLERMGILKRLPNRWNRDGTWNW